MIKPEMVYSIIRKEFKQGITQWRSLLDSTKVGFIGHSYGGGAVPAVSYEWLIKNNWGGQGSFLFIMAPWYSFELSPQQLSSFPSNITMIMQIYENDNTNDHRMAKDIFDNISIAENRKNFIILHSDTTEKPFLIANHSVPSGAFSDSASQLNNLDFYGIWRLLDALESFSLKNDSTASSVALGSGSTEQCFMGIHASGNPIRNLTATHTSFILYPQNSYLNFWSHSINPRNSSLSAFNTEKTKGERRRATIRNYISLRKDQETDSENGSITYSSRVRVSPIDSGFGRQGPYKVSKRAFPHPSMGDGKIYIFSPEGIKTPCPVIVFLHGFPWPVPDFYDGLIQNIVSQGYHLIFPSYVLFEPSLRLNNRKLYNLMVDGADEAFELLGASADTTRIGFIGHAYGGGAVPAMAWHYLKLKEWGKNGAFMFIISPWYTYNFDQSNFSFFPSHVNLLLQVYEDDRFNDWRMAEDLYYSFKTIPSERKDFTIVRNDHYSDRALIAEHISPLSGNDGDLDAVDFYGIYKLTDALAAYSFKADSSAYKTALGNGSFEQNYMGIWSDHTPVTPLEVTDHPVTPHNERAFIFGWNRPWNKRRRNYTPVEKARPTWLYNLVPRD
jgi:pimeloyl-ACP methyl ester carboxylesterase